MKEQILAKALNSVVTGDKFVDKDINKYLYANLSQLSIKIENKHGSDNEHDRDVICPNCGSVINYGKQTRMLSGHIYCYADGCMDKLVRILENKYD